MRWDGLGYAGESECGVGEGDLLEDGLSRVYDESRAGATQQSRFEPEMLGSDSFGGIKNL